MNIHEESERGHHARLMLENPLFVEVTTSMRDGITEKWRSCPLRDREGAHELKLMDKLLTDFIAAFRHIAETGRMADIQLEQDKKIARLKKAGIR